MFLPPVSISVIVPTYNGADKILNILKALNQQSYLNFEVIVAIDGSQDRTQAIVNQFSYRFNRIVVVKQTNSGRAAIRNFGASRAEGNLLIFFDDDMRPVENCVELHVNHHLNFQGSILTGSQIEDYAVVKTDIQRFKADLARKWESGFTHGTRPISNDQLHITAANMSIPADLFKKLDGFDENLTDIEDLDLAIRAQSFGIDIYFNREAIGWHDDFITCRSYIYRRRQYEIAIKKLIDLKPNYSNILGHKSINVFSCKLLIYNLFARKFWIKQIDKKNLIYLPKFLRYWIYELTIWGLSRYFPSRNI